MKIRILFAACLLSLSTISFGQTYGDEESKYVLRDHPEWMVKGDVNLPYDESGNTKYSLSGVGDNWFGGVDLGNSVFYGSPHGCGDYLNRSRFNLGAFIGKWFSPYFGFRIKAQGWKFRNGNEDNQQYVNVHGDIMLNVSSFFHRSSFTIGPRWNVSPFVGGGVLRNTSLNRNRFAINYGILFSYRPAERLNVGLELSGASTKKDWDGYGGTGLGDNLFNVSLGFAVSIGHIGWNAKSGKAISRDYLDRSALEGYGGDNYRMNDYSGINALKKRLENMKDSSNAFMSPVLFFFKINTTTLVDKQQMHNLDEIAHAVNAYDLKVKIIGAADSRTGNKNWNRKLSIERARYIAKCLIRRGVSKDRMIGASLGGVNIYKPYPANRHTCVIVYKNDLDENGYDYGNGK